MLLLASFSLCALWSLSLAGGGEEKAAPARDKELSWAYRVPRSVPLPNVKDAGWVRNPIDTFILARLEEEGLTPAAEADRLTLLRRLSFDLTGLPPTPEEMQRFLADHSPDAYEKRVDRLLASPSYGERWATFWLDLVRYAETDGFKADALRPEAWRYRDYVIRSLNDDKPYDRFVLEQIAGDELFPDDADALVATGFLRHYPDESNAVNLEQRRQEILNDITDTTSQVFLGLTLGCARCHDHKFDPLTQEDYYRVQAFFAAFQPAESPIVGGTAFRQAQAAWQAKTAELRQQMHELEEPVRKSFTAKRKARFPREYQAMYELPAEKRTPLEQQIAFMVSKQVDLEGDEISKSMKPEVRKRWQELAKQMEETAGKPPIGPAAMIMTDVGPAAPATRLLKRGEWRQPDKEIAPSFLSVLREKEPTIAPPTSGKSTGRRAALARWLTRPDHPLTARVLVNRLWQHHFGRGIVGTPSDFGNQGEQPTHPDLLDWLAREFVAEGEVRAEHAVGTARQLNGAWSLKALHRLMVTSATYRQSCRPNESASRVDPENRLLWRMNRRRLDGESLRDAFLAVSGRLNPHAGGPGVQPELPPELASAWAPSKDAAERDRRSVYIFAKRNLRYPLLAAFDAPDGNETCSRRNVSTNAPQALMLLNSKLTLELARSFAGRVARGVSHDPAGKRKLVSRAYELALGRVPTAAEQDAALVFLDKQEAHLRGRLAGKNPPPGPVPMPTALDPAFAAAVVDLCHVLLNTNEFIYVD